MHTIEVYDATDVIDLALTLTDEDSGCIGGPHCPNCRVAIAAGNLNEKMGLPFNFSDGMLQMMAIRLPGTTGKYSQEDGDNALRELRQRYEE